MQEEAMQCFYAFASRPRNIKLTYNNMILTSTRNAHTPMAFPPWNIQEPLYAGYTDFTPKLTLFKECLVSWRVLD